MNTAKSVVWVIAMVLGPALAAQAGVVSWSFTGYVTEVLDAQPGVNTGDGLRGTFSYDPAGATDSKADKDDEGDYRDIPGSVLEIEIGGMTWTWTSIDIKVKDKDDDPNKDGIKTDYKFEVGAKESGDSGFAFGSVKLDWESDDPSFTTGDDLPVSAGAGGSPGELNLGVAYKDTADNKIESHSADKYNDTDPTQRYKISFSVNRLYYGNTAPAAPVPEPATMLLVGFGLIGLAGRLGRKKLSKSRTAD